MRIMCLAFVPWLIVQVTQDSCTGCGPGGIATISADADGDGRTAQDGDCDDGDPYTYEGAPELCDDADNDCNDVIDDVGLQTWFYDGDGDTYGASITADLQSGCDVPGWVLHDYDCDDSNPNINPMAKEACDGFDNDCDGTSDEALDNDGDGFSYCAAEDCDDTRASVHPGAEEVCDGIDDDCDGETDEGVTTWLHLDGDGDGFGNPDVGAPGCDTTAELVDNDGDCDDFDAGAYPGAVEQCGLDEAMGDDDCDGVIDEGCATSYFECSLYTIVDGGQESELADICSVSFQGQEAAYYVPAFIPIMAIYVDQISQAVASGGYACESNSDINDLPADIFYDTAQSDVPLNRQWQWRTCEPPDGYDVTINWLPVDYTDVAVQTFWTYVDSVDPNSTASLYMRVTLTNWYPAERRRVLPVGSSGYQGI